MDIATLLIINGRQCEVFIPDDADFHTLYTDWVEFARVDELYRQGISFLSSRYPGILRTEFPPLCLLNSNSFGPVYHEEKGRHWADEVISSSCVYSPLKDLDLSIVDGNDTPVFGQLNEEFLRSTLFYEQAVFNIKDHEELFDVKTNNRCVIYAHFDSDNIIKQYVLDSLIIFAELGYDILFYTTSSSINNYDSSYLPFTINYVKDTSNIRSGMDWWMWYEGCRRIMEKPWKYDRVLLTNDSMLFGINGLDNMRSTMERMRNNGCDVWGHWDSCEINYHIMSSFMEIKNRVVKYFISFCDTYLFKCKSKLDVIFNCETQFAKHIQKLGFRTDVVVKTSTLDNNCTTPSHNRRNLEKWINNPSCFGIKWKYVISYLQDFQPMLSKEIKEKLRYMHIGKTVGIKEIIYS